MTGDGRETAAEAGVEVLIEEARWEVVDLVALARRAIEATLVHLGIDPDAAEVSLLACDDARIAALNADFRGKPAPTNVLSWPAEDLAPEVPGESPLPPQADPDGSLALGDIAIAFETCAREAEALNKPLSEHTIHLIVHGTLHLLGYDHIRDPDATLMQATEVDILGKMGLDDPYRE